MSNDEHEKKEHEKIEKRISLIEHSIYYIFTVNKWNRINIHQNINRIILLFQIPLATSIYKKKDTEGNNEFCRVFDSIQDPVYREKFEENIKKYHLKKPKEQVLDEKYEKFLCHIGETGYSQIIYSFKGGDDGNIFIPIEKGTKDYKLLHSLWKNVLGSIYSKRIGLEAYLQKVFDSYFDKYENIDTYMLESSINTSYDINNKLIEEQLQKINETVNDFYVDVYNTPIISNQQRFPPNIYFFIRYYDREKNRYNKKYNYSLQIILSPKQEEHFRKLLQLIKRSNRNREKRTWEFNSYSCDDIDRLSIQEISTAEFDDIKPISTFKSVHYNDFYDEECSDSFWSLLYQNDGIDKMIDIIKLPFGNQSRSTADPAMCSGIININDDPFIRDQKYGISRLEEKEWEQGFSSDQVKKYVISHYILNAMAYNFSESRLRSIMLPVRMGASTNICMGCITLLGDKNKNLEENEKEDASWGRLFRFSMDIWDRNLYIFRSKLKSLYMKEIKQIFIDEFKRVIQNENEKFYIEDILKTINKTYIQLCRVYPFGAISLNLENVDKENPNYANIPTLFLDYGINHKIENNPFFDNQVEIDGIKHEDISFILTESIGMVHGVACMHKEKLL